MNLGLGTTAGIGERKSEVSGHRDVTISQSGKFKGKLTNGFLANVYSPVSQKRTDPDDERTKGMLHAIT